MGILEILYRLGKYNKRKQYTIKLLGAKSRITSDMFRFILAMLKKSSVRMSGKP
jgi:hypothetical protein